MNSMGKAEAGESHPLVSETSVAVLLTWIIVEARKSLDRTEEGGASYSEGTNLSSSFDTDDKRALQGAWYHVMQLY